MVTNPYINEYNANQILTDVLFRQKMEEERKKNQSDQFPSVPNLGGMGNIPGFGGDSGMSGITGGSGGSGAGMGAMGYGAIVAALIAAQHALSRQTDTVFEGQKTKDAFSGHYGTEPWFAWASDKLGFGPTPGEKFDAALDNGNYHRALDRAPAMMDYWTDPGRAWNYQIMEGLLGKDVAGFADPISWSVRKLEDIF